MRRQHSPGQCLAVVLLGRWRTPSWNNYLDAGKMVIATAMQCIGEQHEEEGLQMIMM